MRALFLALYAGAALAADPGGLKLQPVYRLKPVADKQEFITVDHYQFKQRLGEIEGVAFHAICTNTWPAGLAPVFAVEKTNRVELRRHPALGQENSSEPLFFALPTDNETEAMKLAGYWDCIGVRATGSKEFFGWELAVDGDKVAGRFDQSTDFRFARIASGTFRSNQLELRVEYIMDVYKVTGTWRDGRLSGIWTRLEDGENGPWEATRPVPTPPPSGRIVNLFEWRRSDGARRYLIEGEQPGAGWQRYDRPLCRVWPGKQ